MKTCRWFFSSSLSLPDYHSGLLSETSSLSILGCLPILSVACAGYVSKWQCASTLFDRGLGARKQRHDRSLVDARGTALRRACRMPQGEPDGGSEGRAFRSGRSPRDGSGRGGPARHDRPNCRRPGTQRSDSRQACDADACCRGTRSRARGQARRDGQEGPADRRARPGGCPRRPRRKDGHARWPQGLTGAPQVTAPARGAEVERARGRAGEGGARARQGRRGAVAAPAGAARFPSSRSSRPSWR